MEKAEYYSKVKGYVKSKVTHHQDAEDLTQHVFMECYKTKKDKEKNIQNHKAYLLGTAKIKVTDYYRQKNKQPRLVQLKPELVIKNYEEIPLSISITKEITEELKNEISQLPPKAKQAIELIIFDNLSYEQAAEKANCNVNVFYKRYYKALEILRKQYSISP